MKIQFDLRKSVNENASMYFEKSKKLRNKIEGVEKTIEKYKEELQKADKKQIEYEEKFAEKKALSQRKKDWYEKFHWFYTSNGNLCIGGKDSGTNEVVIKKHTDDADLVFHTDMAGSPFFVLKVVNPVTEQELEEVASMTACYSKAWKKGLSNTDVFYVKPDQVTKEANAGESLAKGSFMIRGKTTYVRNTLELCIFVEASGRVAVCPESALPKGVEYAKIIQGSTKTSDVAKQLKKRLGGLVDDFVRNLPAGGCKVKDVKKS
ncbi:MAG: NFACT RNA binding domain-containing protein [Candidatus Woesearchaeota archaeon]